LVGAALDAWGRLVVAVELTSELRVEKVRKNYSFYLWRSGRRVRLTKHKARVRIPPGYKVLGRT
jgi:hypothetical protein